MRESEFRSLELFIRNVVELVLLSAGILSVSADSLTIPLPPLAKNLEPTYSPWAKFCRQKRDGNLLPACLTFKNGVIGNEPAVAVVLIEPAGHESETILRITLPLGMDLEKGTKIKIDDTPELDAAYKTCVPTGCESDYD